MGPTPFHVRFPDLARDMDLRARGLRTFTWARGTLQYRRGLTAVYCEEGFDTVAQYEWLRGNVSRAYDALEAFCRLLIRRPWLTLYDPDEVCRFFLSEYSQAPKRADLPRAPFAPRAEGSRIIRTVCAPGQEPRQVAVGEEV